MAPKTLGSRISPALILLLLLAAPLLRAQDTPTGTRNLEVVGRATLDASGMTGELSCVSFDQTSDRSHVALGGTSGWSILDLSDPANPAVLYSESTDQAVSDVAHFRLGEHSYLAVATGLSVWVYDINNAASPDAVASIPTGRHATLFAYRHSSSAAVLVVTAGADAMLYDAAQLAAGSAVVLATIATPAGPDPNATGFESSYLAYHADTETDRFYGAGAGGYHVFDVTHPDSVVYLTSATPAAVRRGHMVSATPDGRYLLAGAEYRAAPLRIFDLKPALDGALTVVRTSLGAWTEDWTSFLLAHETRWPLAFVAAGEHGFQVFNMRDPEGPYTYAYLRTSAAAQGAIDDAPGNVHGAVAVDVRNSDGLIAIADRETGLWLVRLEAFQGWDGRGNGLPNISSVQNWVNGPDGSTSF